LSHIAARAAATCGPIGVQRFDFAPNLFRFFRCICSACDPKPNIAAVSFDHTNAFIESSGFAKQTIDANKVEPNVIQAEPDYVETFPDYVGGKSGPGQCA
jgi:hypothetical protein